jgi:pseudouridine synthase
LDRAAARAGPAVPALENDLTLGDLVPRPMLTSDLGCYGRLDKPTTGLVMLGRDGGIGALLMHPQHNVSKTYVVHLAHTNPLCDGAGDGLVSDAREQFEKGLTLGNGLVCQNAKLQIESKFYDALGGPSCCTCPERRRAFQAARSSISAHKRAAEWGLPIPPPNPEPAAEADSGCPAYTCVRVTVREGKFHLVKRMLAQVGGKGVHR